LAAPEEGRARRPRGAISCRFAPPRPCHFGSRIGTFQRLAAPFRSARDHLSGPVSAEADPVGPRGFEPMLGRLIHELLVFTSAESFVPSKKEATPRTREGNPKKKGRSGRRIPRRFLRRIGTFQWVTATPGEKEFLRAPSRTVHSCDMHAPSRRYPRPKRALSFASFTVTGTLARHGACTSQNFTL